MRYTVCMQFHIPQYIDIEDKLFGPLTLKQGIYVAGGLGAAYLIYRLIPYVFISGPIILAIGLLTWALGFYPKEKLGRPFIEILEAALSYAMKDAQAPFHQNLLAWTSGARPRSSPPKSSPLIKFINKLPKSPVGDIMNEQLRILFFTF
jgi:hypothetical protein